MFVPFVLNLFIFYFKLTEYINELGMVMGEIKVYSLVDQSAL